MRALAHLAPFIGALIINREAAAIYASGEEMPAYLQLLGALLWYGFFVAIIWLAGQRLARWLPGKLLVIERLRGLVEWCGQRIKLFMRVKPKQSTDLSRFEQMPRHKLLPVLLIYSLAPSGFWINVEILRRRKCSTTAAVVWLAPLNALSYKVYFAGMSVLAMIGLDVLFIYLSESVIPYLIIGGLVILVIDGLWYAARHFDDWCINLYVQARVR